MAHDLLLHDADVEGERLDVLVSDGRIEAVGEPLSADRRVETLDVGGNAVIPGLHDHHVHLLSLAASLNSVQVGPPAVNTPAELHAALRAADAALPPGVWLRGVGYDERAGGHLDRRTLDAAVAARPVRIQHRSGALWVVNSAAARELGADVADGRLWRRDAWLRDRLPSSPPPDLKAAGQLLLRAGVTGVTDASPTELRGDVELLAAAVNAGELPQRVLITGGPSLDPDGAPEVPRGPVKLLLPDHEAPSLDDVIAAVLAARTQRRAVAIHCVTRVSLALTMAALDQVGAVPGDRIEHGAVVDLATADRLAVMGVTVVTNPGFVSERGDGYLADADADDLDDLWRCRSLIDRGVGVAAGTDAPFGRPDPWAAIAAATTRTTETGQVLGPDEALPPRQALDLFLTPLEHPGGSPRLVVPGAAADLCVLTTPLAEALTEPAAVTVAAVVIGGDLCYTA